MLVCDIVLFLCVQLVAQSGEGLPSAAALIGRTHSAGLHDWLCSVSHFERAGCGLTCDSCEVHVS